MSRAQQLLHPGFGKKFDWYVNSVSGNDANTGKSTSQALATITALEAKTIAAGDKIGLARGSSWREELNITVANVTIGAYGPGNRPILDASNVDANASFSKTGGQVNVYQISITPEWGSANHLNVWENDVYLSRAASIAACDAAPGSYFPSGAAGAITLYVHASDSSAVTTNGKVYEHSHRQHGINAYLGTRVNVSGIHTRKNLHNGGSLRLGQYGRAYDCVASQNGTYGIYMRTGSRLENCTITDVYNSGTTAALIHANEDTPASEGITITGCTLSISSTTPVGVGRGGFTSHYNTSGTFGSVAISSCTFTSAGNALIDPRDITTLLIENCTFTNCKYIRVDATRAPGGATATISGGTWISNVADQRAVDIQNANQIFTISGFTITTNQRTDRGYIAVAAAATVTVDACTFTNSYTLNARTPIWCNSAGANLTLTDNIYGGAQNWTNIYELNPAPTWMSDRNTFGPNFRTVIGAATYTSLGDHQTATGQDANSTVG